MSSFKEETVMRVSGNPGTGSITTTTAVTGFQSLGSGDDGQIFYILIRTIDAAGQPQSNLWEVHTSTWTNSTKNLSRSSGTVVDGSSGPGTLVNFSAAEQHVYVLYRVSGTSGSAGGDLTGTYPDPTIKSGVNLTGQVQIDSHFGILQSDADGATVTFDMAVSDKHTVTIGGDRQFAVTNDQVGQTFLINVVQDAVGNRTVTWWIGIKWPSAAIPILTTTGTRADVFSFLKTAAGEYYGFTVAQDL